MEESLRNEQHQQHHAKIPQRVPQINTERTALIGSAKRSSSFNPYTERRNNNVADDDEEHFVYMSDYTQQNRTSRGRGHNNNSSIHNNYFSNEESNGGASFLPINSEKNNSAAHLTPFTAPVTTLGDSESISTHQQYFYGNKLLKQIEFTRRWRWSFCVSAVIAVLLSIIVAVGSMYILFFREPFVYIDQAQVYQLPITQQKTVGFKITLNCNNPNLINVDIKSVSLTASVYDPAKNVNYELDQVMDQINGSTTISPSDVTSVYMWPLVYIGDNPNLLQIMSLIVRGAYGLKLEGRISYRVGPFWHSQRLYKFQQHMIVGSQSENKQDYVMLTQAADASLQGE